MVRPASLVYYVPLIGRHSPEIDIVGGIDMTVSGTPAASAHPRVFYPHLRTLGLSAAAAAAAQTSGIIPPFMITRRRAGRRVFR
jgi:hypothetical protein